MPTSEAIDAVRALARLSRLIERASDSLSLADYRVLSAIVAGEERASRLAARLAVGKPTVSASVDSLCRRGLLHKTQVEGDQRATALSLTAEGQSLFDEVEAAMAARIQMLTALTPNPAVPLESLAQLGGAMDTIMLDRAARS
jgi:DNA-binding MarR family transcriptional regulator